MPYLFLFSTAKQWTLLFVTCREKGGEPTEEGRTISHLITQCLFPAYHRFAELSNEALVEALLKASQRSQVFRDTLRDTGEADHRLIISSFVSNAKVITHLHR